MALLVRNLDERHLEGIGKHFCMGVTHHEAGHIAALHGTGPGADADSGDIFVLQMVKQPA